jgi:hypothetical protein
MGAVLLVLLVQVNIIIGAVRPLGVDRQYDGIVLATLVHALASSSVPTSSCFRRM